MVKHIYGCDPQRVDAIKYGLDWYSTGYPPLAPCRRYLHTVTADGVGLEGYCRRQKAIKYIFALKSTFYFAGT